MSLIHEVEEAFFKDSHFGDGQTFLVCSPAFERELADELEKRYAMLWANTGKPTHEGKVSLITEFGGNPVLISEQVQRFKVLTEGRKI